jgi:hypothetical protein
MAEGTFDLVIIAVMYNMYALYHIMV